MRRGGRVTALPVLNRGKSARRGRTGQGRHGGGGHGDNSIQLQTRRPGRRGPAAASGVLSVAAAWRVAAAAASGLGGRGQGTVSTRLPSPKKTEAPEGWQQESVERRAGGGRRACPRLGRARAERPVFLPCPPAWDGPGCWVGTGVRARERERKNTETALVEGQTDRPAYRPCPQPSAAHPLLPQPDPLRPKIKT